MLLQGRSGYAKYARIGLFMPEYNTLGEVGSG